MFTVGEFSKICLVSVKTLHYYDKIGLLKPVRVDGYTGYRYYSKQQLKRMLQIQRFKRYGFSLDEIRYIMECDSQRAVLARMNEQKKKLDRQVKQIEMTIKEMSAHMQSFERYGDIMGYQQGYQIEVKETPVRAVIACRQKMGVSEFGKYYSTLYERVPRERVTPDGIVGAVYYDEEFDHDSSDIELIVGIREKEKADKLMAGELCASTMHKGGYSSLSDAYGALSVWIQENGYEYAGAPYEIYIKTGFDGVEMEDWETEVYFPVKKK